MIVFDLVVAALTPVQSNVLVDANGRARITDFGLYTITQNLDLIRNCSDGHEDRARWIAPEILDGLGTYSKEADVFSFAMLMIEVRGGQRTQVGIWLTVTYINKGFHRMRPVQ